MNKFLDLLLWITTRTTHDDIMWAIMDEYVQPTTNKCEVTKEMLTEEFFTY